MSHGKQVNQGGQPIQNRVNESGQQTHRISEGPSDRFTKNQNDGHRNRSIGRQTHQAGHIFSRRQYWLNSGLHYLSCICTLCRRTLLGKLMHRVVHTLLGAKAPVQTHMLDVTQAG